MTGRPAIGRQDLVLGQAAEERQDHRLHRHNGAIEGPRVPPGLEVVRRAEMGAGRFRGLVLVVAEPHDLRHRLLERGPVQVGRGIVGRVAAEDDERLHRAFLPIAAASSWIVEAGVRLAMRNSSVVPMFPRKALIANAIACAASGRWEPARTSDSPLWASRSAAHSAIHAGSTSRPAAALSKPVSPVTFEASAAAKATMWPEASRSRWSAMVPVMVRLLSAT